MENIVIPALKLSLFTTPTILAIVALVQLGRMKSDLGRTKSVLKAAMVEIERLSRKIPDSKIYEPAVSDDAGNR